MSEEALKRIAVAKEKRLTELDLSFCDLEKIPKQLAELVWLEKLNLSGNKISNLSELAGLTQLTYLFLESNKISNLSELAGLTQLTSLYLGYNQLSDLSELAGLTQLTYLFLESNKISDLSELAGLTQLTSLDLRDNQLSDLSELAGLTQLTSLDLRDNQLSDLSELAGLTQLTSLDLRRNKISDLSKLAGLTQLTSLSLRDNQLSDLSELAGLTQLTSLDLDYNKISDLSKLAGLTQLTSLELSGNKISDLSKLAGLTQLTSLDLDYNKISDLSELAGLTQLTSLDLRGNQLSDLSELAGLTQLTSLHLGSNQLSDLSELAGLTQLTSLDLRGSQLSDLSELAGLTQLTSLDLQKNQINNIKPLLSLIKQKVTITLETGYWGNKKQIALADNPLKSPPIEIVEQGNQAIIQYFEDLEQQGAECLDEAKLIIVGEPEAGKTTLMETLLDPTYQLSKESESTLGIEVRTGWQFTHPQDQQRVFSANIWDFGGQQIQYMTHQFFLTPDAGYILLLDNDRKESSNIPYWFRIIHLLGEEQGRYSPITVVLNHKGTQFIHDFDLKLYQDCYPELSIQVCEVDLSKSNRNSDARYCLLRETVQTQLSQLSHVNDPRPARWKIIRAALAEKAQQNNYISFSQYAEICTQNGVEKEASQILLSGYLHRLGSLLHFIDDLSLRDFIILKPQWAVDAVYSILKDNTVASNKGVFSQAKLDQVWKNYSLIERGHLLNLMQKENFEICYCLDPRKQRYLAPQLVSKTQPDYQWNEQTSLKFRFQYEFMPKGIIIRLIVRLNHLLEQGDTVDLVWRKGLILQDNHCRAKVLEDQNRHGLNVIDIAISSPPSQSAQRKYLLYKIREEIIAIHTKWFKNIQAEQMIPCDCKVCSRSKNPTYFEFSELKQYQHEGIAHINCTKGKIKQVAVLPLLEGFSKPLASPDIPHYASQSEEQKQRIEIHNHISPAAPTIVEASQKKDLEPTRSGETTEVTQAIENPAKDSPQVPSKKASETKGEESTHSRVKTFWGIGLNSAVIGILSSAVVFGLLQYWVSGLSLFASGIIAVFLGGMIAFINHRWNKKASLSSQQMYRKDALLVLGFVLINNTPSIAGQFNISPDIAGQTAFLSLTWGNSLNIGVTVVLSIICIYLLTLSYLSRDKSKKP